MAEKKFKAGDTVCLKSGGPDMSVQGYVGIGLGVVTDDVRSKWFVGTKMFEGEFHQDSLESADDA